MLDFDLRERALLLARDLREEYDLAARLDQFEPWRETSSSEEIPTLHFDDVSGIPFVDDVPGVEEYQHRARIRAGEDDAVATTTAPVSGYERYNRSYLDLGAPTHVVADPGEAPLAVADACARGDAFDTLVEWASGTERIRLEPFMAIEPVWRLASRLEEAADVDATVRGPPPPALWFANDKLRMANLLDRLFDRRLHPEGEVATDVDDMVDGLLELAERFPRVALKRIRCASAMGNLVFDSEQILARDRADLGDEVAEFLDYSGWPEGREVLLVRWLEASLSPSTQGWIPPADEGPPLVDGIYRQMLEGGTCVFAGSRPYQAPPRLRRDLLRTSLGLLEVLQHLGYVGRCSFDFIVSGDPAGDYELRMVDCNGRWGGTSLPMQLVDRLVEGRRPPYRAQDLVGPELEGAEFDDVVDVCDEQLFRTDDQSGRFIFYNVGPLDEYGKLDVVSLGRTQVDAERGLDELLPSLLGL